MIGPTRGRGRARVRNGIRDVQTTVWLTRHLWRPLAAELLPRTPARLAGARRQGHRA